MLLVKRMRCLSRHLKAMITLFRLFHVNASNKEHGSGGATLHSHSLMNPDDNCVVTMLVNTMG